MNPRPCVYCGEPNWARIPTCQCHRDLPGLDPSYLAGRSSPDRRFVLGTAGDPVSVPQRARVRAPRTIVDRLVEA